MYRVHSIRPMVTACMAVLVWSYLVMAQDHAPHQDFEALYARGDQALKAKDADFLNSLLAEDYTEKDDKGTIKTRAQTVEQNNRLVAAIKQVTISTTKVESVKEGKDENEAIVEIASAGNVTMTLADGQLHVIEAKGKSRDTWVRTDGGWKLKYREVLESSGTVDGKTIQQPGEKDESRASRAKLDQLFQELKQSGYDYTVEGEGLYSIAFHGKNFPDFSVGVTSTYDVVSFFVPIADQKELKVTPELVLKLYKAEASMLREKAFYDKEGGLIVAAYLTARTLDARDLKDSIERTANAADTVYGIVKPYLAKAPRKGP
jgi:Domain of unknown function (DUF4440)